VGAFQGRPRRSTVHGAYRKRLNSTALVYVHAGSSPIIAKVERRRRAPCENSDRLLNVIHETPKILISIKNTSAAVLNIVSCRFTSQYPLLERLKALLSCESHVPGPI
jgi:RNase adaptor protein for sRNA GlmZ degradation